MLEVDYPHERLHYTTEVRCDPIHHGLLSATEAVEACHLRYTSTVTMNPVTEICGAIVQCTAADATASLPRSEGIAIVIATCPLERYLRYQPTATMVARIPLYQCL